MLIVLLILSVTVLIASAAHKKSKIVTKETTDMDAVDPDDPATRTRIDTSITHWPHLLGKSAEEAEAAIKADRPDLTVRTLSKVNFKTEYFVFFLTVSQDAMVTMEFKTNRIRIFVDENNIVVRPPVIG